MEPSVFTKIIKGEIPSYKVYEDEQTYAFLDIYSTHEAHVLAVPKKQVEFVWDLDDETYAALMAACKKIALRLREVTGKPYVAEKVVGVDVPHAHVHLIPFTDAAEIREKAAQQPEPDHTALAGVAQRVAF